MATSNKVFVSPGVYTSERDLSFVAQSVGVTTLGIVGETLTGPAFEPIFITNFDEFQTYFGGTNPTKYVNTQIPKYEAAYIAKAYLQQSNQLFVTRVLGLSGYDAGPSWSISVIAEVDGSTTEATTLVGGYIINFSGQKNNSNSIIITDDAELDGFKSFLDGRYDQSYTVFNGSSSTIEEDIKNIINDLINGYDSTTPDEYQNKGYFWGVCPYITYNNIDGLNGFSMTENVNVLNVDNVNFALSDLSSRQNDSWYHSLFYYDNTEAKYFGQSFGIRFVNLTDNGSDNFSGTFEVYGSNYEATAYTEYNDMVIATLRSRGIATYGSDDGPVYEVENPEDLTIDCSEYSGITSNPYETFVIKGTTKDGEDFSFRTSLDISETNYLTKVFGKSNFSKPKNEVPVFVEEVYDSILKDAYLQGKIRGLNCEILPLNGARQDTDNTGIGWYLDRYQTPETPYVVSELRGDKVYNLFKFITISDGNNANTQVKISIANISFNNLTFDILVRDFFDTDANPVVIEKFTNCTMDPSLNNYVGKKVGTANGDFELKSKYVMLELNEEAPVDALPSGFSGYVTRQYGSRKSPKLIYKTKYYQAGDVIYDPLFGSGGGDNLTISGGDKIRKVFLGISDAVGIDVDFLQYKGKQNPTNLGTATESTNWSTMTPGFHLDSGATVVTVSSDYVTSGDSMFVVGEADFRNEPSDEEHPYFRLQSRKFTLLPYGGFDGWDIYREYRTNGDRFVLGAAGFNKGAATSISYPNATGWGAFKQITGPDKQRWGNTDYYAYLWGQHTFANPEAVNINLFVTPGIDYVNNSNLVEEAIDMIETDRADSLYICTTPDYNMFVNTTTSFETDFIRPDEVVDNLEETGIDSNYTGTYYPWILTRDGVNNTQIYIPPTAEVVRNLALTDNIAFPWFASAGYTRGIVNGIKARKKLDQEDRDTLYKDRINPIATFSDVGTLIWGNKTLQVRDSALNRINVRRLLLQARKLISAVAVRLLFEQNDEQVRQQFLDSVNPILDSIRRDRGLTDFRVVVQNTPEDLDANQLVGKIYLKPTRALEFIDIEFLITPTGASFEDI
jgi:hypothetical protein